MIDPIIFYFKSTYGLTGCSLLTHWLIPKATVAIKAKAPTTVPTIVPISLGLVRVSAEAGASDEEDIEASADVKLVLLLTVMYVVPVGPSGLALPIDDDDVAFVGLFTEETESESKGTVISAEIVKNGDDEEIIVVWPSLLI